MKPTDVLDKKDGQDVPWLKNLVDCEAHIRQLGYTEDFQVEGSKLKTYDGKKSFSHNEIKIVNFYRFEGASDPGDNSILYVIEANDGTKGTLADGYGAYASQDVAKFIVKVEEIQKQIPQGNA